jgi:anti-sigma factor RsiW
MKLTCDAVERQLDLFLYGELSFTGEENFQQHLESCERCRTAVAKAQAIHQAIEWAAPAVPDGLLVSARRGLRDRIGESAPVQPGNWTRPWESLWESMNAAAWLKPAGVFAMAALSFAAGRVIAIPGLERTAAPAAVDAAPMATRVRYVEPGVDGSVQIALDETRQRVVSGTLEDPRIKALLIAAAKDPNDPGLRVESVEVLCSRPQEVEVRDALIHALEHDANSGVRLKAIDGLKAYAKDQRTRQALTRVLLNDTNPGVRAQAIDVLTQVRSQDMVGPLQELLRKEDNGYVRMRTERVLEEMKASPGIF